MSLKTYEVKDIYEAAYYHTKGAYFVKARTVTIPRHKHRKKGRRITWVIQMANVPVRAIDDWKTHRATVNIREFKNARLKLKNKVRKYLGELYEN